MCCHMPLNSLRSISRGIQGTTQWSGTNMESHASVGSWSRRYIRQQSRCPPGQARRWLFGSNWLIRNRLPMTSHQQNIIWTILIKKKIANENWRPSRDERTSISSTKGRRYWSCFQLLRLIKNQYKVGARGGITQNKKQSYYKLAPEPLPRWHRFNRLTKLSFELFSASSMKKIKNTKLALE